MRKQPGERDGIREGAAGHDSGQERACVQIARAVEHIRHEFVLHLEETGIYPCDEIPDETIAALDALQDHVLRAAREQRVDDAMRLVVGDVLPAPRIADRLTQDDGGFRQVRRQKIGVRRQIGHGGAKVGRVRGIDLAVIGHDGIDHLEGARIGRIDAADDIDLLGRSEETGIHGIDIDADALPGVEIVVQNIGGVMHVPSRKCGMA